MSADWPIVRLGDYCSKIGSGATPRGGSSVYMDEGDICLIRSQNIYNDGFKSEGLVYITEDAADKLKNVIVEKKDVLLNITGDSVARVCLVKDEFLPARVNQHVAIIRPDPKEFDSRYLRYLLTSQAMQDFLLTIASAGATRNALTKNMIEGLEISKPPIRVQVEIADNLECLDNKIELNRQTNQTLEQIAQAIFKSWFVDFDPVKAKIAAKQNDQDPELAAMCAISGKTEEQLKGLDEAALQQLKTTAALFPDALVESELGEIPEGWGVTRFKKIIEKYIDNRGKTPPIVDSGIPLLEVKHLPDCSMKPDINTTKFVDDETYENWFRAHLEAGDIIISTVGTIGRICMVPENEKITIAQNLLGMRFNKEKASPYFMYYQMDNFRFRHNVDARLIITVQASIKRKDLETIDLLSPALALQNEFENFVKPLVVMQQSNQEIELAKMRDALLPKLLAGDLL